MHALASRDPSSHIRSIGLQPAPDSRDPHLLDLGFPPPALVTHAAFSAAQQVVEFRGWTTVREHGIRLTNVLRHSDAGSLDAAVTYGPGQMWVEVTDDGTPRAGLERAGSPRGPALGRPAWPLRSSSSKPRDPLAGGQRTAPRGARSRLSDFRPPQTGRTTHRRSTEIEEIMVAYRSSFTDIGNLIGGCGRPDTPRSMISLAQTRELSRATVGTRPEKPTLNNVRPRMDE